MSRRIPFRRRRPCLHLTIVVSQHQRHDGRPVWCMPFLLALQCPMHLFSKVNCGCLCVTVRWEIPQIIVPRTELLLYDGYGRYGVGLVPVMS